MGNKFPRVTFKLQEHHPGHFRITVSPIMVDHLRAEKGTLFHQEFFRKGDRIILEEDGVLLELVKEDSDG